MASGYPDYEGDKSKLFTVADWSAVEGIDKNFYGVAATAAFGNFELTQYTIPAGKTLYVTMMSFANHASVAANADLNQMCKGRLVEGIGGTTKIDEGGNGGGAIALNKPIVFTAGQRLDAYCYNESNHACWSHISVGGYEI